MCISIRLALAIALMSSSGCSDSTTPSVGPEDMQVRVHLDSLVTLMERNSIYRNTIDWTAFRRDVLAAGQGATTLDAITPAVELALRKLGDGHSFYKRGDVFVFVPTRDCTAPAPPAVERSANVGYIRVGSVFSENPAELTAIAQRFQDSIRVQDGDNIRGWILDLRGNAGGNPSSMIVGVGPILGEGVAGYLLDRSSGSWSWNYLDGTVFLAGVAQMTLSNPYRVRKPNPPVAVLLDVAVGSAGEGVAASFQNRPNSRFFGSATCGRTTGLASYELTQGATLALAVTFIADRTKRIFEGPIQPDESISDPILLVQRARAWLATR